MTDAACLDLPAIRARFPALRAVGAPVYFDGPAGTQVPDRVLDAIRDYLVGDNANLGGLYPSGRASDRLLADARDDAAAFLGAEPEEIVFGGNTTTITYLVASALARTLAPGDEIVTTRLDHDSNVSPWLQVAEDHGLVVRFVGFRPEDGTLDLDQLATVVGERTRVIAFGLASNALGTINDVARIVELARSVNALVWADGVHFAPHRLIDARAWGLDVVTTSAYKYAGPHLGVAAIRQDLASSWPANKVRPAEETPAGHRYETGTQSHEAIAGFRAALEHLASLTDGDGTLRSRLERSYGAIRRHEDQLTRRLLDGFAGVEGLRVHGLVAPERLAERTATFTVRHDRVRPADLAEALGTRDVYVAHGDYYAWDAMHVLGLAPEGGVRVGAVHYTDDGDVDRLLEALAEACT